MIASWKEVYKDLFRYKDRPSKCMLINEAYGINDMDSNQFANRIKSDHSIWTHFTDFIFRFSSRPDYYNRMTILERRCVNMELGMHIILIKMVI